LAEARALRNIAFVNALSRLLALDFARDVHVRQQEFIRGTFHQEFAVFQITENSGRRRSTIASARTRFRSVRVHSVICCASSHSSRRHKKTPANEHHRRYFALKDAGRGLAGDRRFAVRGTLVVAQIAVSLMLVTAAGLFLRSFASLNQLSLGFVPEPLLIAELSLQASDAPIEERGPRAERLRAAAAAVPGVRSASLSGCRCSLAGAGEPTESLSTIGPCPSRIAALNDSGAMPQPPGWFDTMGTPLVDGRDFTDGDRVGAPLVAIVNHAFVSRYQLGQQPIGRTVRIGLSNGKRRYEIVGLVGDSVYTSPRDGMMATMYVPIAQLDPRIMETVILTINADRGRRAAVEREVAAALARTEPTVAFTFRTFD
jgi:putative ABC transport system permease protein